LVVGPGFSDTKQYVIIETGCSFPLYDGISHQKDKHRSDTVIQAVNSDEVVFIYGAFLCPVLPKHNIMIDIKTDGCLITGQYVEISDKLYKEIKRKP